VSSTRFAVNHRTFYRYTRDMTVAYNRAHLLPRTTDHQHVLHHLLVIDPPPDDRWDTTDIDGNLVTYFSLERPHQHLEVSASSEIELEDKREIPDAAHEPWEAVVLAMDASAGPELAFRFDSPLVRRSVELAAYAAESFEPGRPLLEAITDLTSRIFTELTYLPGSTTVSTPAEEVLHRRQGVCQDFAHLAGGCLRSLGLVARYVSGYLETSPPDGEPALVGAAASHAWCSVRLADGCWLDFDPTNDLVQPAQHLTVAWGRDYGDVAPVSGVVFGNGGSSTLEVAVDVVRLS
jgi:transglutaminase-like putative cysteine protease